MVFPDFKDFLGRGLRIWSHHIGPEAQEVAMRLEHKVALITGGYGGMGRSSSRLFAREGATVFVAGRDRGRGDALVAEINDAGGKAHFVELDVVNQDQWDAAVAQVKDQAGALHVLMNIVGSNALVRFPHVDIEELTKVFEINVTGTLRGIQTCAPLIRTPAAARSSTSDRSPASPATSAPPTPHPNGRWRDSLAPPPTSTPTGASAPTSSSPAGSRPT
jgi:NAD(P)-dependent dehydrogenase (short-subunit alcohol dehydrogenase family)